MLEHNNFEVYKHYSGYICISAEGILRAKGGFNQVNVGKFKDDYLITLEHALLDTNLLSRLQGKGISKGKTLRVEDSSIKLTLIQRIPNTASSIVIPNLINKLANGVDIAEWQATEVIPQMIVVGEALSPTISRLILITLKAANISINQDMSKFVQPEESEFPVFNRENAQPSIYGPLV